MTDTKTCKKCGDDKPLNGFHRHSQHADGRVDVCKQCVSEDQRQKLKETKMPFYMKNGVPCFKHLKLATI